MVRSMRKLDGRRIVLAGRSSSVTKNGMVRDLGLDGSEIVFVLEGSKNLIRGLVSKPHT